MRFEKLGVTQTTVPYIGLALLALLGYGMHLSGMVLFDDDLAGRFKGISNPSALARATESFERWLMGRPFGHASNVTFHTMFRDFPEWTLLSFAFVMLSLQSFLVFRIGEEAGLGRNASFVGAAFFLITPAAISLNLVVHSLATEWSTWFMLAATLAALRGHFILAGAIAALQVNVYETYLTIFFLPFLFPVARSFINRIFHWKSHAINFSKYTVSFFIIFALFLWVRAVKDAAGRAALLEGMGPLEVMGRMLSAGWIGLATLFDLHFDAFEWAMQSGPSYIFGFFLLIAVGVFICLRAIFRTRPIEDSPSGSPHLRTLLIGLSLAFTGIVIAYMSYMIFFEKRYPPDYQTSRLANIHGGARFGIFFIAAGLVWIAAWLKHRIQATARLASKLLSAESAGVLFVSLVMASFVSFNHAYGYQQVVQAGKRQAIVDALYVGCQHASPGDTIVVIADDEINRTSTDRVLTWGMVYLGDVAFAGWDNRILLVRGHNRQLFVSALEEEGDISGQQLASIVDPAFSLYAWLFPRGDVARWDLKEEEMVVLDLQLSPRGYQVELLQGASNEIRACYRRTG